jgi:hypothetical protein
MKCEPSLPRFFRVSLDQNPCDASCSAAIRATIARIFPYASTYVLSWSAQDQDRGWYEFLCKKHNAIQCVRLSRVHPLSAIPWWELE